MGRVEIAALKCAEFERLLKDVQASGVSRRMVSSTQQELKGQRGISENDNNASSTGNDQPYRLPSGVTLNKLSDGANDSSVDRLSTGSIAKRRRPQQDDNGDAKHNKVR